MRIERSTPERLVAVPEGSLGQALAQKLHDALSAALAEKPASQVLVDLRGVDDYQPAAREILLAAQRALAKQGCRSAWLAERARLRGLALWLMHAADDPASRAVMTPEQAEAWLVGGERRIDDARSRTQEALRAVERSLRRLERLK
jgi:anti-anti-sigma regulatory factor